MLRVYLSSDVDLLFLWCLEVTEHGFAAIKADQGILVDFANFSGKLIGLLEKCIASSGSEDWRQAADDSKQQGRAQPRRSQLKLSAGRLCRFQVMLDAGGASGTLRVVEHNDFNQLPHITLTLMQADHPMRAQARGGARARGLAAACSARPLLCNCARPRVRRGSALGRTLGTSFLLQFLAFRMSELHTERSHLSVELGRAQVRCWQRRRPVKHRRAPAGASHRARPGHVQPQPHAPSASGAVPPQRVAAWSAPALRTYCCCRLPCCSGRAQPAALLTGGGQEGRRSRAAGPPSGAGRAHGRGFGPRGCGFRGQGARDRAASREAPQVWLLRRR